MMNSNIKQLPHQAKAPLSIERDISMGHEISIIEGVRYDAEYFRTFACPEADVLYSVRRNDDNVWLTIIRNMDEAKVFFEEIGQGDPAPTEEQNVL
jgi:hypothetical protein